MKVPKEGYDDFVSIPECEPTIIEQAIEDAVRLGLLWLTNAASLHIGRNGSSWDPELDGDSPAAS